MIVDRRELRDDASPGCCAMLQRQSADAVA
jgi:hypothetical protein